MGIDVYHGTGPVDWGKVRAAGHGFGIVKATEGISLIDGRLAENFAGMKAAGVVRGAYHFFHVGADATVQANHFLNAVRAVGYDSASDIPLVLDLEDRAGAQAHGLDVMREGVNTFLSVVESAIGRLAVIYMDTDFANNFEGDGHSGHPLWVANYTTAPQPTLPKWATDWKFWQWSDNGTVDGIEGAVVDLNHYNGTLDDLIAWIKG